MGNANRGHRKKVFISGPIQGMEENQSYREYLRQLLVAHGYQVLDPWEREKVKYSHTGSQWWKNVPHSEFIGRDLKDIRECDLLVAYFPILSAGSCMELFYAKSIGKKTIVICELKNPSPWVIAHSDLFFNKIDEFKRWLQVNPLN